MTTAHLTKMIHAIRTQTEPYVSRIQIKFRVRSIYFSPLRPISGVSQHRILLAFLFISKQTLQTWYYRRIPHYLRRNSLPGMLPLDIARIIFSNLVTQCTAYGACIQILVLASVEDAVVGHACIFCTSSPKGQTSFLASYVVAGNSLSLGSIL